MDAHRWQRIREIFEAAVELPPRERDPYIKKVCEGDTALFEELMAMLEADGTGHRLLDQPVRETVDPFFQTDLTGRRFGRFRIIREIGSGGMGAVYLAERADGQYEQQVALKLIKPGLHSGDLVRRFEHERQILARLEHPNIARLLDGGISDEGTPYFVMEYVSGLPIDRYCNQNRLTIEERVRLFITVCQAVQFAHYNLVIHRDLKPGNIFITDDGTVKLLDFGIAKVFSEEQELPALTRTGNYALTPEFAAPEQIRNQHITTATDVYALGLILFELLCGQRPFEFDSTSLLEMERIIETTDPPRPSSMIKKRLAGKEKTLIGEAISASEQRQTSPERLFRKLRGDLDTICLMALNREPARRYGSAELFMQDLDRFLRGLPVRARRESLPYRLQKFARRHRWGVITTAVVSLILITVVSYYTILLSDQRDRALTEARKAQAVSAFLSDLFNVADPYESRGRTITAREILDRGAQKIRADLEHQPETQATMYDVIGNVYINLGLFDEALPLLKQSLALRQNLFGEYHPDVAESMASLGYLYCEVAQYEKADSLLSRSISITEKISGPDDPALAKSCGGLAWVRNNMGDYAQADTLYRKTMAIQAAHDDPELGVTMNNLALLMHEMNRYEEAETYFNQSLELLKKTYGEVHPEVATTLYNYAQLQRDMDHIDEAVEIHRQVLAMDRRLYGDEHPNVAYSLNGLAGLLVNTGELDEAEVLYRQALAMRRKLLGDDHPNVAYNLNNLGRLLLEKGSYREAKDCFFEALEIHRRANGEEHQAVARTLKNIGAAYYQLHDLAQSKKYLTDAVNMSLRVLGEQHFTTANTMLFLSKTLAALGEYDHAISYAETAYNTAVELLGDDHSFPVSCKANLQEILRNSRRDLSYFGKE